MWWTDEASWVCGLVIMTLFIDPNQIWNGNDWVWQESCGAVTWVMSGGVWRRGDLVVVGLSVLMLLYLLAPDCRCQSFFIKLVILFQQFHCFGHVYVGFYILKEISRYFIVTFEWFSTFRNRLRINVDNFADLYSFTTLQRHYPSILSPQVCMYELSNIYDTY